MGNNTEFAAVVCFLDLPTNKSLGILESKLSQLIEKLTAGRCITFIWESPTGFDLEINVDAWIKSRFLSGESTFSFSTSGAIRCFDKKNRVSKTLLMITIRSKGPKAYSRRKEVLPKVLKASALPVLHPVFTRDVANNIWHISDLGWQTTLTNRILSLQIWSDERAVVVRNGLAKEIDWSAANYEESLVPQAIKYDYSFEEQK